MGIRIVAFFVLLVCTSMILAAKTERVMIEHGPMSWRTAVAPAGAAIIHTEQVYVLATIGGNVVPQSDTRGEASRVLKQLLVKLAAANAGPEHLLRINIYATTPEAAAAARQVFEQKLSPLPPITCVVTALAHPKAMIAADAVAWTSPHQIQSVMIRDDLSILPSGGATFISGQAAKGDMAIATRETMTGLGRTLEHLGLTKKDVAQVKCFLQPMSEMPAAQREVEAFFGDLPVPPIVWVEWTMTAPIEIEMVAKEAPRQTLRDDRVEFITPPWFKPSPVYCKVTIVHGGRLIFTSGLTSNEPLPPADEVRDIFTTLQQLVAKSGSDMKHLAKATYYPATAETSKALNDIRPEFYDPQRPPAASKAPVRGTGVEGRNVTLDLIGVTSP